MTAAGALSEVRPGVWRVRVYVGTVDGREVVRSRTFRADGKRAAENEAKAIRQQLREGQVAKAVASERLAGLVDEWLEIKQSKSSPTTIYRIRPIVDRIKQRLGHIRVDELTARDVERFYAWLRTTPVRTGRNRQHEMMLSESTVHHHHRILASILNTGERWGRVSASVMRRVEAPSRGVPLVNPPTREQIAEVIKQDPNGWGPVYAFAAVTGMRRGEICGARWSDITPDGLVVQRAIVKALDGTLTPKSTKTRRPRVVPLDDTTLRLLEEVRGRAVAVAEAHGKKLAANAYLFPEQTQDYTGRKPRHPDDLSLAWRSDAQKAGVAARLHDLRHYAATYYLKAGIPVNDVANLLGHAQASTTVNVYGHAGERAAIAALMAGANPNDVARDAEKPAAPAG